MPVASASSLLAISATFPYPPTRGGTQVRTFHLLNYLSQRHRVTLVTLQEPDITAAEIETLRQQVAELVVFPRPPEAKGGLAAKVGRFANFVATGTPASTRSRYSPEMQAWIDGFVAAGKADIITCEHSVNEGYVRPPWRDRARTAVNIHSSLYGTCQQQLDSGTSQHPQRDRLMLPLLKRYEQRFCQKFSHIVVTTEDDRQFFANFAPSEAIAVIPNGVDLERFPYRTQDPGGYGLVFVGAMDNLPNIDAACFFSREVFPLLRQTYPDLTLTLVGSNPVPEVAALAALPGVSVTGRVPSMAEYLHQATVCIVPMRTGFGIKNKTLEAMAAGVPVVASDRGLEGLAVDAPGIPLRALRANQVSEYITAITTLLESPQLRQDLSHHARQLIEIEYTWAVAGQRYETFLLGDK